MRSFSIGSFGRLAALALAIGLLAACGGHATKPDAVQAGNIPSSFDVTVTAEKDGQFDYEEAPLTSEDLKSAFRYRQEESLPMQTVLLVPGEKQRIKNEHMVALARIAQQLKIQAFMLEKNGQVSELQTNAQ